MYFVTEWSAPSAIGIAGLGGGFEVGAEVNSTYFPLRKYSICAVCVIGHVGCE